MSRSLRVDTYVLPLLAEPSSSESTDVFFRKLNRSINRALSICPDRGSGLWRVCLCLEDRNVLIERLLFILSPSASTFINNRAPWATFLICWTGDYGNVDLPFGRLRFRVMSDTRAELSPIDVLSQVRRDHRHPSSTSPSTIQFNAMRCASIESR